LEEHLKALLFIGLFVSTFSLFASERKYSDLVYSPNHGDFVVEAKYGSTYNKTKWEYLSREYFTSETNSDRASIGFGYGFSNNFAMAVRGSQLLTSKQEITYGPASTLNTQKFTYKSSGMEDPEIKAIYRARDGAAEGELSTIVYLEVTPKTKKAISATTTAKGNAANGGTNVQIGTEFGSKNANVSYSFDISLTSNGESKSKSATTGSETTTEAYGVLQGIASAQWQFGEKTNLRGSLGLGSVGKTKTKYANGTFYEYESSLLVILGGAIYHEVANKAYLFAELAGVGVSERTVKDETGIQIDETENSAGVFSVGFAKEF